MHLENYEQTQAEQKQAKIIKIVSPLSRWFKGESSPQGGDIPIHLLKKKQQRLRREPQSQERDQWIDWLTDAIKEKGKWGRGRVHYTQRQ